MQGEEKKNSQYVCELKEKLEDLNKRVKEIEDYLEIPEELKKNEIDEDEEIEEEDTKEKEETSKFGVGFLFSFVSFIGLILGLVLYKEDTFERKTFIKGWVIGFVVGIIAGIIIGLIYYAIVVGEINKTLGGYLSLFY